MGVLWPDEEIARPNAVGLGASFQSARAREPDQCQTAGPTDEAIAGAVRGAAATRRGRTRSSEAWHFALALRGFEARTLLGYRRYPTAHRASKRNLHGRGR
jgi:hypothetical protein